MNLIAFLRQNKVEFEFLEKKSTHHATEASKAANIPLDRIVKTLVFVDQDSKPLIAIVRADHSVSRHKLESCSGSKSVKIASDVIYQRDSIALYSGIAADCLHLKSCVSLHRSSNT